MKMWLLSILLPGLILTANACGPAEEPGKTVVPFCTSHSSGIGSSDTDLHFGIAGGVETGETFRWK